MWQVADPTRERMPQVRDTHTFVVREAAAKGYRSLRSVRVSTGRLAVFVGGNGVGKTSLYRALQLLQGAAAGTLARQVAAEGGMEAAIWAGPRRSHEQARIALECGLGPADGDEGETTYSYQVELGFPPPLGASREAFPAEPQVKEERFFFHHGRRPVALLERRGAAVFARDAEGRRSEVAADLLASETAFGALDDPARFPELHDARRAMLDWRFYHDLRTDPDSPLRRPSLAVASPTLRSDGGNLAAVFATLVHLRQDTAALDRAIDDAFPGARLDVPLPDRAASFGLVFPDHPRRVFDAAELSDGTLRYLALAGALLSLRLPCFLALNEPEASLHPDLLEPLARLVAAASLRTQIWLVTHSERLAAALEREGSARPRRITKEAGETAIEDEEDGAAFRHPPAKRAR